MEELIRIRKAEEQNILQNIAKDMASQKFGLTNQDRRLIKVQTRSYTRQHQSRAGWAGAV